MMTIEDRVETLSVRVTEDGRAPYLNEPGFVAAQRREAAFTIADKLFAEASILREEKVDDWRVERTWTVSVVMPENGRNRFAEQMEESYRKGLLAASKRLRETAERYRIRNAGYCSFGIASALDTVAKEVVKLQLSPPTGA
jgi:hypothetical protein